MIDRKCKKILRLVEDIYKTVEHPACWQEVLQVLSEYIGDGKAALTIRDNTEKHIYVDRYKQNKVYGFSMDGLGEYITKYHLEDVWIPIEAKCGVGEICRFSTYLPVAELKKTTFYKEWLFTQNIMDGIALQIFKNKDIRIVLNVFFSSSTSQVNKLLQDIEILVPHFCQAAKLWMKSAGIDLGAGINYHQENFKKKYNITDRQLEYLLTHIRTGNNQKTADIMGIDVSTTYTYAKRIKEKLDVKSIASAKHLLEGFTNEL